MLHRRLRSDLFLIVQMTLTRGLSMKFNVMKKIGLLFFVLILSGCAASQPAQVAKKPVIRTIAILPVKDPEWFALENRNIARVVIPLIGLANKLDSREKAKRFTEAMVRQQTSLASDLTAMLVSALNARGYQSFVLNDVKGPPEDPENIDFTVLKDKVDAVLSVSIYEIGVYAGDMNASYLPNISLYGSVISTADGNYLYDETLYYGVNARNNVSWGILAAPDFTYPTFESLMENTEEVGKKLNIGTQALGTRMVDHIDKAL